MKRQFIMANYDVPFVFVDACDLRHAAAFEARTQQQQLVSPCDILIAGFSCKTVSSLNSARSSSCCTTGEGSTGITWTAVKELVGARPPAVIILENVTGLLNEGSGGNGRICDGSNLGEVLGFLRMSGYSVHYDVLDAREYGLPQRRRRVWFIAAREVDIPWR
jgi:DNA (cytosine-5)-methyltransferase 1